MIIASVFHKDETVVDGTIVALCNGQVLWAGPAERCPLDSVVFQERPGVKLHMHPSLYDRIDAAMKRAAKGATYGSTS